jgi:type IV pilus assembly protein PilX
VSTVGNRRICRHPASQSGIVLITGLIFTVILTLLVLAGVRTGILEERMASNARNRQVALQAAEAVLRDGEVALFSEGTVAAPFDPWIPTTFADGCTSGLCSKPAAGSTPRWKTYDWSDSGIYRTFASNASNLSSSLVPSQPVYFVELMTTPVIGPSGGGGICPTVVYRLTARGSGLDAATVYVQTMYRMRPKFC